MKMTKLIYLFAVPLLVASCISEEVPITDASDHFFKVSAANPDIQQIVFLLKQKNDSVEFTSKFHVSRQKIISLLMLMVTQCGRMLDLSVKTGVKYTQFR